ncbi:hypothetical protein PR003_g11746 [Phytophthora rubi]|uniref:Uncharacterized protein n=1 Tax=Phytophthora rubi TaxID=129364 RepID=A0A6A3MLK4_9STRA|nr:hypothetical protein PR002_g9488 [Phytophthora rubi]KAE9035604.1 hypothetical protein PR001_g9232 [Phytophthora rubi]KAE9337965.1 hypothetical protein PR003_g11746 [Phytophthora rubi]
MPRARCASLSRLIRGRRSTCAIPTCVAPAVGVHSADDLAGSGRLLSPREHGIHLRALSRRVWPHRHLAVCVPSSQGGKTDCCAEERDSAPGGTTLCGQWLPSRRPPRGIRE